NGHVFYRLRINNLNGNVQYSSVRRIHFTGKERQFVQSGLVSDRDLRVILPEGYQKLEILNSGGAVVATKNISGTMGSQTIPLPGLASGIYLVVLKANDHFITEKILLQ